jgi:hypothetical protein
VSLLLIAVGFLFLAVTASTVLTLLAIEDQVEDGLDLPLHERTSWAGRRLTKQGSLWWYIKLHRRIFPRSGVRRWFWISVAIQVPVSLAFGVLWFEARWN